MIGSLQDRDLLDRVFSNADALHESVAAAMQPPLADRRGLRLGRRDRRRAHRRHERGRSSRGRRARSGVVTRSDLLEYLAHRR